jgi:hypothetical protein
MLVLDGNSYKNYFKCFHISVDRDVYCMMWIQSTDIQCWKNTGCSHADSTLTGLSTFNIPHILKWTGLLQSNWILMPATTYSNELITVRFHTIIQHLKLNLNNLILVLSFWAGTFCITLSLKVFQYFGKDYSCHFQAESTGWSKSHATHIKIFIDGCNSMPFNRTNKQTISL